MSALVIDEAQSLPDELLEEIRLLANIESATEKLLSIVLAGQPELADRLNEPSLRQLKQRVGAALRAAAARPGGDRRLHRGADAGRRRRGRRSMFTREAVDTDARARRAAFRARSASSATTRWSPASRSIAGRSTRDIVLEVCRDFDFDARQRRAGCGRDEHERQVRRTCRRGVQRRTGTSDMTDWLMRFNAPTGSTPPRRRRSSRHHRRRAGAVAHAPVRAAASLVADCVRNRAPRVTIAPARVHATDAPPKAADRLAGAAPARAAPTRIRPRLIARRRTTPYDLAIGSGLVGKLVGTDGFSRRRAEQYRKLAAMLHHAQVERGAEGRS